MMRTDSKGRSASPHRITYKSDFHAIKCSFDTGTSLQSGTKAAAAAQCSDVHLPSLSDPSNSSSTGSRGRVHSTRGTKIRENIFLQMDSQQLKQDGGPVPSSGSTPLLSPHNPSLQPQTSPFSGSRRSFVSSSSVLGAVANISTPESSLQDRLSRSEEIADIDRAALAQKFSVTRKLFETKVMEGECSGGQVSKGITGRGSKGMADGNAEEKEGRGVDSQLEKGEEVSGERKHTQEDSFDKHESMNLPIINISLPKPHVQGSLMEHPKSPVLDGPEASNTSSDPDKYNHSTGLQKEEKGAESATLDLCLTPEEPVRAELVDVKNESSESDENEEEKIRKGAKNWLKDEGGKYTDKVAGESIQDLVDDVFEEPRLETTAYALENGVGLRAGDGRPVVPSGEHQKESSASMWCETETKDDEERGGDKYRQVNEQWEEQSRQFIAQAEKSTEKGDCREEKTDAGVEESAGRQERGMMQEEGLDKGVESNSVGKRKGGEEACRLSREKERTEKDEKSEKDLQEERANEEVEHEEGSEGQDHVSGGQEDQTGSAVICGIENEAFVYEQESQSHPEHSTPPRQEAGQLLLEYEEIPGVPEVADQEDEDAAEVAKRKVRFSSAPIMVRNTLLGFQHLLLTAVGSRLCKLMVKACV